MNTPSYTIDDDPPCDIIVSFMGGWKWSSWVRWSIIIIGWLVFMWWFYSTMMLSLLFMLANILKEEEIRDLFMISCYLKCKVLIIICMVATKLLLLIHI
jgi:hypothetical protein